MTNETVIKVSDLHKQYGDIKAVDGISFEVTKGHIYSLLGPNGAGKTTTVEMMEGLRTPTSGNIQVFGVDVLQDYASIRHRVGVIPQDFEPFERLKAPEAVAYFGGLYNRKMSRQDVDELLDTVQLGHRKNILAMKLSGGEQRKLGLALALVGKPDLLFLDEPTTGLDAQARRNLWGLLEELRAAGRTIVLTTHYLDEAEKLSDAVFVIHQGKQIAQGSPNDLIEQYGGGKSILLSHFDDAYLDKLSAMGMAFEKSNGDLKLKLEAGITAKDIFDRLSNAGIPFKDFSTIEPTLEDAFINLVGGTIVSGELTQ